MISAAQSRVARTLLAWSQQELAREAGVGSSTIADFERGHRAPIENSIEAIKSTFERNGIRFVADSAVMETEINNIIVRTKLNQPLRWIDSTDLENWADRRDSQSTFPELISRLLIATYGPGVSIRFPSGDSVQFAGFDGISDAPVERHPVPAGKTVWELGTTGKSIKAKAQEDYAKRSQPSESILHSECTFAFVTLRRWPDKTKWAAARRIEKIWKNIIVIDADDLVHWLDQCPQAARWLAIRIGKRPNGIQGLEEKWSEWSNATHPSLNSAIVLISRDTEAATTLKWLKGDPAVFAIEADSANEALAFLCSTIFQLSDHMCNFQLSRAFVLNNPFDARELGQSASPLILCLSFIDAELAQSLASNGHHVFVACEHNETVSGNTLRLNRPDRYELKDQLVKILATDPERGVHNNNKRDIDNEAERLSKDSGRSLTILRRQIAAVPDRLPAWAKTPDRSLIAALLAGGWNGANEGDRHILSQLAGCPYDEFERRLAPILLVSDSPLRKSEDAWRIASPRDAFGLLSSCIVVQDLDLFVDAFDTVLSLPDPRFRLESSERWRASLSNMAPAHSPHLRRGLTETATLISVFHDNVRLAPDSYQRIERAVSDILKSANGEIWWSLHRDLQNLAEAAPDAFLTALETKLDAKQSPLAELFKASDGPLGGEEYLSNLLWGLERLAWIKEYFPRVADILIRLCLVDPGGKWGNRPSGTLRNLFLNWSPQCNLRLAERLEVIDCIRKNHGKLSWAFLLSLAPKPMDHVSPGQQPQWRNFDEASENITYELLASAGNAIASRLLDDVGDDAQRWIAILQPHSEFSSAHRAEFRKRLLATVKKIDDVTDRGLLRAQLQKFVNRHRRFLKTDWAMPEVELAELEVAISLLEPKEIAEKAAWLFQTHPPLPNPPSEFDHEAEGKRAHAMRVGAVQNIFANDGFEGLFTLAAKSKHPYLIGHAFEGAKLNDGREIELLDRCFGSQDVRIQEIARGLLGKRHFTDIAWCDDYLKHSIGKGAVPDQLVFILLSWRFQRSTWDTVEKLSSIISDSYWQKTDWRFWGEVDDCVYVAEKLLSAKRIRAAICHLGSSLEVVLPSSLIITALTAGINATPEGQDGFGNEGAMFNWYLTNLLKSLEVDNSVDRHVIAKFEWAYFPLLKYSERKPKELPRLLSDDPAFFTNLLSMVYKRSDGKADPESANTSEDAVILAYEVLKDWNVVPGSIVDNTIDENTLIHWVVEARSLCNIAGRQRAGDNTIGTMLASVRPTDNGEWPPIAIRNLIEFVKSEQLERGYAQGLYNSRGVTSRGMSDGGAQERDLAATYRLHAAHCRVISPRTARILDNMARSYDQDATRHDEDVIRLQW